MTRQAALSHETVNPRVRSLGVVSFLNARPLWWSLSDRADLAIRPAVPSKLAAVLQDRSCDAALLPVVDYWKGRDHLRLVSNACIASDGETLTVRVFSKVPPERLDCLHVDGDSHTSVVLAQVVWRELYGRSLELRRWAPVPATGSAATGTEAVAADAVLLIGDKVVRDAPRGFGFQVDLGAAWRHVTGLPFVFAAWAAEPGAAGDELARLLEAARDAGVAAVEEIARQESPAHGWPPQLALTYLRDIMRYTMTDAMRAGLDRFFELAAKHGFLR